MSQSAYPLSSATAASGPSCSLACLPDTLHNRIFSYLQPRDLVTVSGACWTFFVIANNEELWKYHVLLDLIDFSSIKRRKRGERVPLWEHKVAQFTYKGSWKLTYLLPQRLGTEPPSPSAPPVLQQMAAANAVLVANGDHSLCFLQNVRKFQALQASRGAQGLSHELLASSPSAVNFFTMRGEVLRPPPYALAMARPSKAYRWYNVIGADLVRLLPPVPNYSTAVERRHCSTLSRAEFIQRYEMPNVPVIIQGLMDAWPAMKEWRIDNFVKKFGEVPLKVNGRSSRGTRFRLKTFDFLAYCDGWNGEKPLYVFDKKVAHQIVPELQQHYAIPEYFTEDLFSLMDEEERPDYRWLLLGPNGSGSPFHQDPHMTSAWNAVIEGVKRVSFYPPQFIPPGIDEDLIHSDYYAGDDTMEWYKETLPRLIQKGKGTELAGYAADAETRSRLKKRLRRDHDRPPIECFVQPGEVLFIPSGWWHQVQNIGHCIAVTQNVCSTVTFPTVAADMNRHAGRRLRAEFRLALQQSPQYSHLAQHIHVGRRVDTDSDSSSDDSSSSSSSSSSDGSSSDDSSSDSD